MGIANVAEGTTQAQVQQVFRDLVSFFSGSAAAAAITNWATATTAFNAIAKNIGVAQLNNFDPGVSALARINAVIAASGIPDNAGWYYDAAEDRIFGLAALPTFARNQVAYWTQPNGTVREFAAGARRRLAGRGTLLLPARRYINTLSNDLRSSNWNTSSGTSKTELTPSGVFVGPVRITKATGVAQSFIYRAGTGAALAAGLYRVRVRYRSGQGDRAQFALRTTGTMRSGVAGFCGALAVENTDLGPVTNVVNTDLGGGLYEVQFTVGLVAASTAASSIGLWLGPDLVDNGSYVDVEAATFAVGDAPVEWNFTTTQTTVADVLTLALPAANPPWEVTMGMEDGTVRKVGRRGSGNFAVPTDTVPVRSISAVSREHAVGTVSEITSGGYFIRTVSSSRSGSLADATNTGWSVAEAVDDGGAALLGGAVGFNVTVDRATGQTSDISSIVSRLNTLEVNGRRFGLGEDGWTRVSATQAKAVFPTLVNPEFVLQVGTSYVLRLSDGGN